MVEHARKRESQCVVYVHYLAFFCRFWLELFVGFLHTDKYCCSPDYTSFVLLSESWFLIFGDVLVNVAGGRIRLTLDYVPIHHRRATATPAI